MHIQHNSVKLGLAFFILLEGLVFYQAYLANADSFLTAGQMKQKGIEQGLPFLWHFGMWGDIFIVSPLAALVVGKYSRRWRPSGIAIAIVLAILASTGMHWFYTYSTAPEAHIQNHALTPVGYVHVVYMAVAIAVFLLFYFFTLSPSPWFAIFTTSLLIMHIFLGTHLALGVILTVAVLPWYPNQPLSDGSSWTTFLVLSGGLILQTFRILRDKAAIGLNKL